MRGLFVMFALVVLSGSPAQSASIKGKVIFEGTAPPEKSITEAMKSDPNCAAMHAGKPEVMTEHYVIGEDKGLKWVFVHIKEGLGDQKFEPSSEPVLLDQVDCVYVPHVFGVQVGQELIVRNSDATLHNVHIIPGRDSKNPEMNKGMPFKMDLPAMKFEHPEVPLRFKCDVHRWMFAYCNVVEHPFFATTDDAGTFEIPNVPDGTYQLAFWHKRMGEQLVEVTVAGADVEVDFTFTEAMIPKRGGE